MATLYDLNDIPQVEIKNLGIEGSYQVGETYYLRGITCASLGLSEQTLLVDDPKETRYFYNKDDDYYLPTEAFVMSIEILESKSFIELTYVDCNLDEDFPMTHQITPDDDISYYDIEYVIDKKAYTSLRKFNFITTLQKLA